MATARNPLDHAIHELETRIDRLRALYEQYFMGVERLEPAVARKDVEVRIAELRKAKFNNTAKRFKFQTLVQRYNTMQQYWSRTCREIENGTYRRQKLRAERRMGSLNEAKMEAVLGEEGAQKGATATTQETQAALSNMLDENVDLEAELKAALQHAEAGSKNQADAPPSSRRLSDLPPQPKKSPSLGPSPQPRGLLASLGREEPARKGPPGPPPRGQTPPARAPAPPGRPPLPPPRGNAGAADLSSQRVQELHQAYQSARRQTNARDVSFEKLERKIRETEKALRAAHPGRKVDFEVSVQDGRAMLKPKLR